MADSSAFWILSLNREVVSLQNCFDMVKPHRNFVASEVPSGDGALDHKLQGHLLQQTVESPLQVSRNVERIFYF